MTQPRRRGELGDAVLGGEDDFTAHTGRRLRGAASDAISSLHHPRAGGAPVVGRAGQERQREPGAGALPLSAVPSAGVTCRTDSCQKPIASE